MWGVQAVYSCLMVSDRIIRSRVRACPFPQTPPPPPPHAFRLVRLDTTNSICWSYQPDPNTLVVCSMAAFFPLFFAPLFLSSFFSRGRNVTWCKAWQLEQDHAPFSDSPWLDFSGLRVKRKCLTNMVWRLQSHKKNPANILRNRFLLSS